MDLERFSRDTEVQSLIISSILEEILHNHKGVIALIPEAWKFIPQKRGNPCKNVVEEFIRQGATNKNYLWIDSQDMSGVDKTPLKQISEWILGYQSEKNEVKHTLDQIPLPKASKPKEEDIMKLGTGIFYYSSRELTTEVYIQPFWLDDDKSKQIAKGEINLSEIDAPKQISQNKMILQEKPTETADNDSLKEIKSQINKELLELRTDVFNKFEDLQEQINKAFVDIANLKTAEHQEINEEELLSKILLKLPKNDINMDLIVSQVLEKIPKMQGTTSYEVEPLEALRQKFLEEGKAKIMEDISTLDDKEKKILKYLESVGKGVSLNEIVTKCLLMKQSGGTDSRTRETLKKLSTLELCNTRNKGKYNAQLREKITRLLEPHNPAEADITNLYNHIIMEML